MPRAAVLCEVPGNESWKCMRRWCGVFIVEGGEVYLASHSVSIGCALLCASSEKRPSSPTLVVLGMT